MAEKAQNEVIEMPVRPRHVGLASHACARCLGLGCVTYGSGASFSVADCRCVWRKIFRICFDRYRSCIARRKRYGNRITLELLNRGRRQTWAWKNEEFTADFCLVSKRVLGTQYSLFQLHFLEDQDWKACTARLGMNRGTFFHEIYEIQERLGRVFHDLKPYALWPLDEYFGGAVRNVKPTPCVDRVATLRAA